MYRIWNRTDRGQSYTEKFPHIMRKDEEKRRGNFPVYVSNSVRTYTVKKLNKRKLSYRKIAVLGMKKAPCWCWNILSLTHTGILHSSTSEISEEGLIFYILCSPCKVNLRKIQEMSSGMEKCKISAWAIHSVRVLESFVRSCNSVPCRHSFKY